LKKRIKMKRTVSCRFYNTGKILTNPTSVVTKGLNHPKNFGGAQDLLADLDRPPDREKGQRSDPSAFQKMEDRMKRCSCLASMSIDKRFYKSSFKMLQKL
jgi:hypothetical protein